MHVHTTLAKNERKKEEHWRVWGFVPIEDVGNVKVFLSSSISASALSCLLTFIQLKATTFHLKYIN